MKKSAASKRADMIKDNGSEWYGGFVYSEVKGLGYEEGVHRRDPSSVIFADGLYYVWYTKSVGPHFLEFKDRAPKGKKFPWDYADIWYATSEDGMTWKEQGCAVHRGERGEYDERTLCTPDCVEYNGKYYLVYQAISQGDYTGENENVAMAVAEKPEGPWVKTMSNILEPMQSGEWFGKECGDSYNAGYYMGLTHDPMLIPYKDKFYLYYKCGAIKMGELKCSGPDTRWGVAIADNVTGPYVHSEYNPVTNSGHETMLWKYKGGIAALLNRDGPEKDTIQYAPDGINFEVMSHVYDTPMAGGAYRGTDNDEAPLEGIRWGMCHCDERASQWNYIMRFDMDSRHPYGFPHQYPANNCQGLGWA